MSAKDFWALVCWMLHRFMFGLKPEIRLHVALKQPASLADAIELAIQVDSLLWQARISLHLSF